MDLLRLSAICEGLRGCFCNCKPMSLHSHHHLCIPASTSSAPVRSDGGSYLHAGWGFARKPNSAPRLNDVGKLSWGWNPAETVIRRFDARLLASNGPGTWLPWRFCCGGELRTKR